MTTPETSELKPVPGSTTWRARFHWILGAIVIFVAACPFEALEFPHQNTWPGWATLCLGWLGLLVGEFGWIANLFLFAAWIFLAIAHYRTAVILSALGFLCALHTYALFAIPIPSDESAVNPPVHLQSIGPAFALWLASMLLTIVGAVVGLVTRVARTLSGRGHVEGHA